MGCWEYTREDKDELREADSLEFKQIIAEEVVVYIEKYGHTPDIFHELLTNIKEAWLVERLASLFHELIQSDELVSDFKDLSYVATGNTALAAIIKRQFLGDRYNHHELRNPALTAALIEIVGVDVAKKHASTLLDNTTSAAAELELWRAGVVDKCMYEGYVADFKGGGE